MEMNDYFDFSRYFSSGITAVISKYGIIPNSISHKEKIRYFSQKMNINFDSIAIPNQTHSNNCKTIGKPNIYQNMDGLISRNLELILCLSVADCCPIFIEDKKNNRIGLIHSGWKGTVNKIVINAVNSFLILGSNINDLIIFLGPSIGPCCYEVGPEISDLFINNCKSKTNSSKYLIDIKEQIKYDLLKYGLQNEQIKISNICTFDNMNCESYRRDGDLSGRMIALMGKFNI
jgi:polyphenol oxidase